MLYDPHNMKQYFCAQPARSQRFLCMTVLQNKAEVAGHLSRLFFVSFACGWVMFWFTSYFSTPLLKGTFSTFILRGARTSTNISVVVAWLGVRFFL